MRILLSAYACDPGAGSEPGAGWNWAKQLSSVGHDVWVLTGDPFRDRKRLLDQARGVENLHVIDVAMPPRARLLLRRPLGVYVHYLYWLRYSHKTAKKLVRSATFDLAHHVSLGSLMWGCRLWRLPIPLVFGPVGGGQTTPSSLRGYLGEGRRREALRSLLVRRLMPLNPMGRSTVQHAAIVLATNADTVRLARRLGGAQVQLVPDTAVPANLPVTDRRAPTPHGTLEVLWLGRLYPIKGLALALDALSRIPPDVDWRCTVVGDGPSGKHVTRLLDRFGVASRTTWLGQVPWEAVGQLYEQADLFLFTSLRDSLGGQLYEASAFALPMVVLDHHGVADLIPEDVAVKVGVGTAEETAQGLAEAIEGLARAPKKREQRSAAALKFAERNAWSARVSETYSMIESGLRLAGGEH